MGPPELGYPSRERMGGLESVKDFFCFDIPPGGREKDSRKTIVNRKRKNSEKGDDNSLVLPESHFTKSTP
jgi:hypothetical protein